SLLTFPGNHTHHESVRLRRRGAEAADFWHSARWLLSRRSPRRAPRLTEAQTSTLRRRDDFNFFMRWVGIAETQIAAPLDSNRGRLVKPKRIAIAIGRGRPIPGEAPPD